MKTAIPPVPSNGKLHELEAHLRQRIRGQDHVLPRIVSILRRGELGLTKPGRPRGSFLFLGPTGVGKTEVTLAFTRFPDEQGTLVPLRHVRVPNAGEFGPIARRKAR